MLDKYPTLVRFERGDLDAQHLGAEGGLHDPFWVVSKRHGVISLDLICVRGISDDGGVIRGCGERRSVSTMRYSWSSSSGQPRVAKNERKRMVLAGLARLGGSATCGDIATASGLDRTRVDSVLKGNTKLKGPYVLRSSERELTATGSSHYWSLTARGRLWLAWAAAQGLVRGPRSRVPSDE